MFSFLKNHPFANEAFFESSIILTFAFPKKQLAELIPPCLTLDTLNDNWAFIAIAMVQTKELRPKGFPKCLGNNFFLIGYRIFVRYINNEGKNLRGLYILKSETDKKKMEILGNIFTHYNYTTTDIFQKRTGTLKEIGSIKSDFNLLIDTSKQNILLPDNSPFENWKQARRFAGPLPFTFTFDNKTKKVLIIEGVRQHWVPEPLHVISQNFSFFKSMNLVNPLLANAFVIDKVPYSWKRGKIEIWKK